MIKMIKYCAFTYTKFSDNVGDDIQTLAAMQFLPRVDFFINRETMNEYSEHDLFLIANGWYMHQPSHFPPPENIKPFYISVHIASESFLTPELIEHFKENEPIGCRDYNTATMLRSKGILSYLSRCLTLTLRNKSKERSDNIYLVDIRKNENTRPIISKIPKDILHKGEKITHLTKKGGVHDDRITILRLEKAMDLIELYSQAKFVITSRIHCALPCIALKTPVLFIPPKEEDIRFTIDLLDRIKIDSFYSDGFCITNPPDASFEAKIATRICKRAVKEHDNPLKEFKHRIKEADRILTIEELGSIIEI